MVFVHDKDWFVDVSRVRSKDHAQESAYAARRCGRPADDRARNQPRRLLQEHRVGPTSRQVSVINVRL